jgi:hypothetical protein
MDLWEGRAAGSCGVEDRSEETDNGRKAISMSVLTT